MIPLTDQLVLVATIVLWCSVFLIVVGLEGMVERWWTRKGHASLSGNGFILLAVPFFTAGFVALAFEEYAGQVPTPFLRVVLGTMFVSALAAALFVVKGRWLRVYAAMEIAFALLVVGHTMRLLGDQIAPIETVQLVTGGYLIVRGLDNFKKGLDAAKEENGRPKAAES